MCKCHRGKSSNSVRFEMSELVNCSTCQQKHSHSTVNTWYWLTSTTAAVLYYRVMLLYYAPGPSIDEASHGTICKLCFIHIQINSEPAAIMAATVSPVTVLLLVALCARVRFQASAADAMSLASLSPHCYCGLLANLNQSFTLELICCHS